MSRANVANPSARVGDWQHFAVFFAAKLRSGRLRASVHFQKPRLETLARWAFPVALVAFIVILVAASISFRFIEQDHIVEAANNDVELTASVIADDIAVQIRQSPVDTPADALAHALPLRALGRGQRVLLSDESGKIVASYPPGIPKGNIADHLGGSGPLTIFAEKAGVLRVVLPDGTDALATVRTVPSPFGQIAIIHPMANVLRDWSVAFTRTMVLLLCTAFVLSALAYAYFWQATKARRADLVCQQMRDRVDMVLMRGRCGLWDWDLASDEIDWSLSMFEIVGLAPRKQPLSAVELRAMIHPDDKGLEAIAGALSGGGLRTAEQIFRMRKVDGGWVWLRAKAELVDEDDGTPHLVGIAVDISETMALEERTAKADMRLRDAIETISEAFVVWDADNRLVMCNSKFQRFHNLPLHAVAVGTPYTQVMEYGAPPLIQSQVALGEPQPMGARTFEAQLGDGRWLQINERRTKDGGYVSVGTDITALKRHEEQLIESERRLMNSVVDLRRSRQIKETQAQQLAELAEKYREQKAEAENANRAKSDFLANMGHELRTPLNAILGFSEIMMLESYGGLGSPLYVEYSRDIHNSGQYLLNVIADVLEMSRLEAGRVRLTKTDFVVADAITSATAGVAAMARSKTVALDTKVVSQARLLADRTAFEKILIILLNNAIKYTPADGQVMVRTRLTPGAVEVIVEDTGIGIPCEAIARLGRPFEQSEHTLENGMRGSGLGLAIARSLLDLHGGSLQISSKEGVGTTVVVVMPNQRSVVTPKPQFAAAMPGVSAARVTSKPSRFALQPADRSARRLSRTG